MKHPVFKPIITHLSHYPAPSPTSSCEQVCSGRDNINYYSQNSFPSQSFSPSTVQFSSPRVSTPMNNIKCFATPFHIAVHSVFLSLPFQDILKLCMYLYRQGTQDRVPAFPG